MLRTQPCTCFNLYIYAMAFSVTVTDLPVFKRYTEDYFISANEDGCFPFFLCVSFEASGGNGG